MAARCRLRCQPGRGADKRSQAPGRGNRRTTLSAHPGSQASRTPRCSRMCHSAACRKPERSGRRARATSAGRLAVPAIYPLPALQRGADLRPGPGSSSRKPGSFSSLPILHTPLLGGRPCAAHACPAGHLALPDPLWYARWRRIIYPMTLADWVGCGDPSYRARLQEPPAGCLSQCARRLVFHARHLGVGRASQYTSVERHSEAIGACSGGTA